MTGAARPWLVTMRGPDPVGPTGLRLEPGVTALYGLNGAGKTSILKSISGAFSGMDVAAGSRPTLHFQLTPEAMDEEVPAHLPEEGLIQLHQALTLAIRRHARALAGEEALLSSHLRSLASSVRWLVERRLHDPDEEFLDELLQQGRFALEATGQNDASWDILICAVLDSGTPRIALAKAMDDVRMADIDADEAPIFDFLEAYRGTDLPSFVPVPVEFGGSLDDGEAIPLVIDEEFLAVDLRTHTEQLLFAGEADVLEVVDGTIRLSSPRQGLVDALGDRAAELARSLLLDPPMFGYVTWDPAQWATGPPGSWIAFDVPTATQVELGDLSRAQRRWVSVAAALAVTEAMIDVGSDALGVLLLDEPEEALHVRAERHMVAGLKRLAHELASPVLVATHSREFLNNPEVRLVHVTRGADGATQAWTMTPELRRSLSAEDLGLEPADLLQSYRAFLLVEGTHDEIVFETLFGGELEEGRVRVIPFRGVANAVSIADAAILFDFTQADLVIVVDHLKVPSLVDDWSRAQQAAKTNVEKAKRHLKRLQDAGHPERGTEEARVIYDLAVRALERGRADRITLLGLKETDIYRYLPVNAFVADVGDWSVLEQEWKKAGRSPAFKQWMREVKQAPIDEASVREAALSLREPPSDLVEIVQTCRATGRIDSSLVFR